MVTFFCQKFLTTVIPSEYTTQVGSTIRSVTLQLHNFYVLVVLLEGPRERAEPAPPF